MDIYVSPNLSINNLEDSMPSDQIRGGLNWVPSGFEACARQRTQCLGDRLLDQFRMLVNRPRNNRGTSHSDLMVGLSTTESDLNRRVGPVEDMTVLQIPAIAHLADLDFTWGDE